MTIIFFMPLAISHYDKAQAGMFAIWLRGWLCHGVSSDDLYAKAQVLNIDTGQLYDVLAQVRTQAKALPDPQLIVQLPRPGHVTNISPLYHSIAVEQGVFYLLVSRTQPQQHQATLIVPQFSPQQSWSDFHIAHIDNHPLPSCTTDLTTSYEQWFDIQHNLIPLCEQEMIITREYNSYSPAIPANYHTKNSWQQNRKITQHSYEWLAEINNYILEHPCGPLPHILSRRILNLAEKLQFIGAILEMSQHAIAMPSPNFSGILTRLENFYYSALAAMINSACEQYNHP